LGKSTRSAFLSLYLSKERPPRASRAAGELSLNCARPQPLRTGLAKRPLNLSLALSLDKERVQKGSSQLCKALLDKERDQQKTVRRREKAA
jgi:hypothetical protein